MALSILVDKLYPLILCKKKTLILLKQLCHYGIRGVSRNWINHYLKDRSKYVQYNNINTNHGHSQLGVPQGSIFGPLLFLPNASELLLYLLFTYDTNIFVSSDFLTNICTVLNVFKV